MGLGSHQGVAKLTVMSMLTGQVFVEWTASTKGAGFENFPVMAMHLGYTALGLWGNGGATGDPNVLLFHTDRGNKTVMEYSAKGSVMAIDMVHTPFASPSRWHHQSSTSSPASVHLIVAAKLEHANVAGKGGQCVAFCVPVETRASPHPRKGLDDNNDGEDAGNRPADNRSTTKPTRYP